MSRYTDYVNGMVKGYGVCLLWQATDPDTMEPLDDEYGTEDFSYDLWVEIVKDCQAFYDSNRDDLEGIDPEQAGHDFMLTRNRHGAGFWDRGLGDRGERLTQSAHGFGSHDVMPVLESIRSV